MNSTTRTASDGADIHYYRWLSVYIFSGSRDPVHGRRGLDKLVASYRGQVDQLTYKLYPDGRHEMLNEVNRIEVMGDLVVWLKRTLNRSGGSPCHVG